MNETGRVIAPSGLNLHQHPDKHSPILYALRFDAMVKIESVHGGWYHIRTAWGERGYVAKEWVQTTPSGPVESGLPPEDTQIYEGPPRPPLHPDWFAVACILGGFGVLIGFALLWSWFYP
jgi:Bacterial SH3 domain